MIRKLLLQRIWIGRLHFLPRSFGCALALDAVARIGLWAEKVLSVLIIACTKRSQSTHVGKSSVNFDLLFTIAALDLSVSATCSATMQLLCNQNPHEAQDFDLEPTR